MPRELDRLEGAAEDVVVGDGDRAEALGLGVVEQRLRLDRAVVRPVRVHVEVDDDPVAVAERIAVEVRPVCRRAPPAGHRRVDVLEPLREPVEIGGDGLRARRLARARPQRVVLGESRHRRGGELGLVGEAGGVGDRAAARLRLEQQARAAAGCRHEDGAPRPASRGGRRASRAIVFAPGSRIAAGIVGRRVSGAVRASTTSQPGSVGSSRSTALATALWPGASSTTISFRFAVGANAAVSTPSGIVS